MNLLKKIIRKDTLVCCAPAAGNHTVTIVQLIERAAIFKIPKSFILFLFAKGNTGKEYKNAIIPSTPITKIC